MKKTILALSVTLLTFVNVSAQSPVKDIEFGGRIMYDMAVWGDTEMDNSGTEFRRVRFYNSGKLYGNVKLEKGGDVLVGDVGKFNVYTGKGEISIMPSDDGTKKKVYGIIKSKKK